MTKKPLLKSSISKWLLPVIASTTLMSCAQNDVSDLKEFIEQVKVKYTGQVEALPIISPYDSYRYLVTRQRDPFRPSVALVKQVKIKRRTNGLRPNEVRNKEGLEKYDLQSLFMVGIMNNDGQNWAIVKAPDGTIFRVRKGNYIGENHGKILRITESGVELREIVPDGDGGWANRKNKLNLSE